MLDLISLNNLIVFMDMKQCQKFSRSNNIDYIIQS